MSGVPSRSVIVWNVRSTSGCRLTSQGNASPAAMSTTATRAPVADGRFAAMVEHEKRVRALTHERHDLAQLIVCHAQIEGESSPPDLAHAVYEFPLHTEPRRLPLDVVANALHPWAPHQGIERRAEALHVDK